MGTCKKRPQRDRGPRRAQVPSRCPILFCRHTASAQGPSRRPCLLDKCAVGGCRLPQRTRPRIGNRFGNVRGFRQPNSANNGFRRVSADRDPSGAYDWCGLPSALTRDPPASPERGRRLDMPHGYSWTEPDSGGTGSCGATSSVGTQPPHPRRRCDAGADTANAGPGSDQPDRPDGCRPLGRKRQAAHNRTGSGTPLTDRHFEAGCKKCRCAGQ